MSDYKHKIIFNSDKESEAQQGKAKSSDSKLDYQQETSDALNSRSCLPATCLSENGRKSEV